MSQDHRAATDHGRSGTLPLLAAVLSLGIGLFALARTLSATSALGTRTSVALGEAALLAPFVAVPALTRRRAAPALALRRVSGRTLVLSLAAGAAFWIASAGLIECQARFWPPPEDVVNVFRRLHADLRPSGPLAALTSVAALALAPALAEEVAFRGAILGSLRPWLGPAGAVAWSAAAFSAIHISPGGYRVPFAFLLGLALGTLRLRTGSVFPAVAAHAALNTITLSLAQSIDEGSLSAGAVPLGAALALLGAGTLLSIVAIRTVPRVDSRETSSSNGPPS